MHHAFEMIIYSITTALVAASLLVIASDKNESAFTRGYVQGLSECYQE